MDVIEVYKSMSDEDIAKFLIKRRELSDDKTKLDDSFYICDLGKLLGKWKKWKHICPDYICFYAVKCNNNIVLLKIMAAVGINFDCASMCEIKMLIEIGITSNRIILTHPHSPTSHLQYAMDHGVDLMVFDCLEQLRKIHDVCGGDFPRLVLRICVQNENLFGDKFGAKEDEFINLISAAKKLKMTLFGLCFHCGSRSGARVKTTIFENAIKSCKYAYDIATQFGYQIQMLDIGGGFIDNYGDIIGFDEAISATQKQIASSFSNEECSKFKIAGEPGRYLVHPAYNIVSRVIGKRRMCGNKFYYFVGEGVYNTFAGHLDNYIHEDPVTLTVHTCNTTTPCTIFGPTLSGADTVLREGNLPELYIGDYLMWKNKGEYSSTSTSGFNGFKINDYYYVISEEMSDWLENETPISKIVGIKFNKFQIKK